MSEGASLGPWSRGMTSPLRGEGHAFESHRAHNPPFFLFSLFSLFSQFSLFPVGIHLASIDCVDSSLSMIGSTCPNKHKTTNEGLSCDGAGDVKKLLKEFDLKSCGNVSPLMSEES